MSKVFKNSAENRFKRILKYGLIINGISLILGVLLLFLSKASNKTFGLITGTIYLLFGVTFIYKYLQRDGAKLYSLNLIYGILCSLLGLITVFYPFRDAKLVTVFLGIFLTINGLVKLNYSFWLKKGSEESWNIVLTSGILLIIFGILMMLNPFVQMAINLVVGIFIIICSIFDITITILFKNRFKEIKDIFW